LTFPANIQLQLIDDLQDDGDVNFGPLEETSPSSSINNNDEISRFRGLKRKLSPEANLDENESTSLRYFTRPSIDNLKSFFEFHPHQPCADVPFNTQRAYFRLDANGQKVQRQWLTYASKERTVRCSICIAFGKSSDSVFYCDVDDKKHFYTRIKEHEECKTHSVNVEAYMVYKSECMIRNVRNDTLVSQRLVEINYRRNVLTRVIETVKLIGKSGLAIRGKRNEAVYKLFDDSRNHGNFLEIIKLVGKFDAILQSHLTTVVEKSNMAMKKQSAKKDKKKSKNRGRGSLITFMSKTTISKLIGIMKDIIQKTISKEVQEAKIFSVEIDTTQDVSCQDQCSIILRYAHNGLVCERLLFFVKATSSTGEGLFDLLKANLDRLNIDMENCIGDSFDGAANMSGQYRGVQARIREVAENHVHVWCYAHTLNLVLGDTTSSTVPAMSYFTLLNSTATFVRGSYKNMNEWINCLSEKVGTAKLMKLNTIGKTRWWAKAGAVQKIFGEFGNEEAVNKSLYVDVLTCFSEIVSSPRFNVTARDEARTLVDKLTKFETILTAATFNRIFAITTPLSEYLQTSGLDILQAWRMVESAIEKLERISRDFSTVLRVATQFAENANNQLASLNSDV
jgi:hypothetical protein